MKDLTGQKFGRLTVIADTGKRRNGKVIWKCRCECGNITEVRSNNLLSGNTKSCGCLQKEMIEKKHTKHGDNRKGERQRLYRIWTKMKERCQNPNNRDFKYYGERGIKVCDEWENDYLAFKSWALANDYREGLTIDRIDNNGDYSPENCQWLTRAENSRKARRDKKRAYF